MRKSNLVGYLILAILFILISIVVFVVPGAKTTAFWIAYLFTAATFAAQIVIWKAAFGREDTLRSRFLGLPVVHVGFVWLGIQTIILAVYRFVAVLPTWSAIVACSIVAGLSAICLLSVDEGQTEIEQIEIQVQKKVLYIQSLQVDIELLAENEDDAETKKLLLQLAERIRFSDPMSHEQLSDLEDRLFAKVDELKTGANKKVLISEINLLLSERNKKCKILK